jgi:hypothetical protein
MQLYTFLLPEGPGRTVVLLADPGQRTRVPAWLVLFAHDAVHLVSADSAPEWRRANVRYQFHSAADLNAVATLLRGLGPADVVVDMTQGSAAELERTWRRLFYHLKHDGVYVVDRSGAADPHFRRALNTWIARITTGDEPNPVPPAQPGDRHYADAVASVTLSRDLLIVKKRHKHYLKLRDAETNHVLAVREPKVHVNELRTLPSGVLQSRAEVVSHESGVAIPWLPEELSYPQLHLRHFRGRVAFVGNALLHTEQSILSESFRWHRIHDPTNPRIRNVSPSFARIPGSLRPRETLEGHYYQIDPQYPGHFGHFMTESISRLWGWDQAKQLIPELKVIYHVRDATLALEGFENRLLRAYGIDAADIIAVDHPVYLESLVSATAMWHNADPHYVHPDLSRVWDRITASLVTVDQPQYERIFVSRAQNSRRRTCRNVEDVEAFFAQHGFAVVYPERLTLGEQATMFATTPIIAGFGGSAIFNVMHARNLKTLILLSHEAYTARNEHLYSALLGGAVHYFWSPPDIAHPPGGWSQRAFDSDWEFDFGRNGDPLRMLLSSL